MLDQGEAENDNLSVRLKQRILSVGMQPPPNFDGAWSLKKAK
ncbi:MAG TPA: hypothetical protein V6D23_26425 [Candidatus Obscuribacterales bacterium]